MKKSAIKVLSVMLTVVLLLSAAPLSGFVGLNLSGLFSFESEALTSGDFTYTVSGSNATITGYSGSVTNLTIPSTLGGYKVTTIKHGMFNGDNNLVSVTLPSTLTMLGDSSISTGVFQNCKNLKTVTFAAGSNDAKIGRWAFSGCSSLEEVVIPGNYVRIGIYSFENCISLKSFKYEKSSYSYANQVIEDNCFQGCTNLKEVSLPITLSYIGSYAFQNCTSLEKLVVPEGVTTVKHGAFNGNANLQSVYLPSTLTMLGDSSYSVGVFQNCKKLKTVTFAAGSNDAKIGRWAFSGCSSLEEVVIPGNYVRIGIYSFENCISLKSFKYEKSSYSYANQVIEDNCFQGCTNLKEVSLPTTLSYIGSYAFQNCTSLEKLVVPEGVTTIKHGAFNGNTKLVFVYFPSTLRLLGDTSYSVYTFGGCEKLEKVIFAEGSDDLTIGLLSFVDCPNLMMVHIPLNAKSICNYSFRNVNANLTICSLSTSSYAKTYADSNGIKFKVCDSHEDEIKYTVAYNANGGSVTPTSVDVVAKKSTTLPTPTKSYTVSFNANGGSNAPASLKAALTCLGWATSASATSATYSCGAAFTPTNNTTLYAVWKANASFTVPSGEPVRDGYEFLGWAASADSTTATFHAGDKVNISGGNVTYYAVWKEIPSLTISQTELTLDLDNVDTGFATVTVNRPSNEALTLEAASSSTSVVMVELGDYDNTNDTCPATFIVEGEGTCTVTFKLYSADKSVLYDTEIVTINVEQDATKQISMNYNGVTVIDDFDGVYFESLNPDVATVDDSGRITATGRGTAVILVMDIDGNVSYYNITVSFSILQWIIYIIFFGWLWY